MNGKKELISILLVDDEPHFRQGIRTLLNFYNNSSGVDLDIVGEAASVEQALKLTAEQHPALILLDLELPPDDGITALLRLGELSYHGKVLILSAHQQDEWVFRAMQAGAWGYVFKDQLATQLCQAISTVMDNKVYLPPEVATGFFRLFHYYTGHSLNSGNGIHLTEREREVLNWLVQGASNEQIAGHLYITVATVKAHLTAIFEKLGVTSRTQAIVKALKLGLVCP
ncbi:response regulator containing a CheY-like receiver domain and an HTH DNA-binding domain [Cylindrospermum stagnale PCC 7417]|uniref:Response regulator containing a CheY-like receiver domain and an HTH DNA-binding domain n=1 Tax=Cylindrospermum stagnale PCC 7417 TaxID=56107 RepID=K9WXE3_9NOST|nr:response regulator transcription factor [Cylindrospermum stagnale]AFZ24167.1 response regulator containing a CheY-like receiver domain and an HTH DNA-binding domain [Cylindrospermum stagnale PCC 7417]